MKGLGGPQRRISGRRRQRGRRAIIIVAVAALACWTLRPPWNGEKSRSSLSFEEALDIAENPAEDIERRRSALGRLMILSTEAGHLFSDIEAEELLRDIKNWRERVLRAWKEK